MCVPARVHVCAPDSLACGPHGLGVDARVPAVGDDEGAQFVHLDVVVGPAGRLTSLSRRLVRALGGQQRQRWQHTPTQRQRPLTRTNTATAAYREH